MASTDKFYRKDGHIYYIVDSEGRQRTVMGVSFLDYYDQLEEHKTEPGLWFVRDAAPDSTGQHGDPTVYYGWAMYTWDTQKTVTETGFEPGWRKVSEQESLDVAYMDKFVPRAVYEADINDPDTGLKAKMTNAESDIVDIQSAIGDLEEGTTVAGSLKTINDTLTEHGGKLDKISYENEQFKYNGTVISGNTFIYDHIVDGQLVWHDPTKEEQTETVVSNSKSVADNFITTGIVTTGMRLAVVEVDGGVTTYQFVNYGSVFKAVPVVSSTSESLGTVNYVGTLPDCSKAYVGRGLFSPIEDDEIHTPGHIFEATLKDGSYVWSDRSTDESGTTITETGASFTLAYGVESARAPFSSFRIFWNEPDDESGVAIWYKTVLVRKFGSAPENATDGDIVFTSTSRTLSSSGFEDTCPFSEKQVYYRLFSTTRSGSSYTATDAIAPEYLEWSDIATAFANSLTSKIFSVGDKIVISGTDDGTVVAPFPCKVTNVYDTSVVVVPDGVEVMSPSDDFVIDEAISCTIVRSGTTLTQITLSSK